MFALRLKELRENAGLSQAQLARKLGVGQSTVGMWENGKNKPQNAKLEMLAKIFGVSYDYLMGRNDIQHDNSSGVRVPVLGSIPAGIPLQEIEDIRDWEEIPSEWLVGGKEYFALEVHGNSMYPRYEEGDVLILRKQDSCENGQDCAVMIDGGEATFKRVKLSEKGIVLQPINPDYEPLVFTNREIADLPVKIIGVVVELRRKL